MYPSPTNEALRTESGVVTPQSLYHPGEDEFGQQEAVRGGTANPFIPPFLPSCHLLEGA